MKRSEILDTAKEYVTKDRASQHGDAENNLTAISDGWNWWMSIRNGGEPARFSAMDVAVMMAILKVGRVASNSKNADNFIDACGYMALAGEVA